MIFTCIIASTWIFNRVWACKQIIYISIRINIRIEKNIVKAPLRWSFKVFYLKNVLETLIVFVFINQLQNDVQSIFLEFAHYFSWTIEKKTVTFHFDTCLRFKQIRWHGHCVNDINSKSSFASNFNIKRRSIAGLF